MCTLIFQIYIKFLFLRLFFAFVGGLARYVLLRCPKFSARKRCSQNFDRCHSLALLNLPPAALGSLPPSIRFHIIDRVCPRAITVYHNFFVLSMIHFIKLKKQLTFPQSRANLTKSYLKQAFRGASDDSFRRPSP